MFRVLDQQMARLGQRARAGFVTRMADYLAGAHEEWVGRRSRAELEEWVSAAVKRAERWGVTHEGPVAQYMLLLLVLGDDADERLSWVKEALDDDRLVDLGKVRKLIASARAANIADLDRVTVVREVCE